MTTASTTLLGLALPVTGELSGTWGDVVNASLTNLLDTAIAGTTTLSSDADVTLSTTTLSANQARQAVILWTAGGTVTRTMTAPAQSKSYVVINATSSSQSIKLVGVGPTTGITIVAGEKCFAAWNGTDFVKVGNTSGAGVFSTVTASSLTSGRVTYAGTAGLLQDSANLTFNGTTLTANTIGAFTLAGTVAGGGNQINNVIIGTTNPLAGAFTTLSTTSFGVFGARTQIKGTNADITGATGSGTEIFGGSTPGILAYNRDGSAYLPLTINASILYLQQSGTTVGLFSSTGLAVTGVLTSTLDATIYGVTVGRGGGAVSTNTAVGASALAANTTGLGNVALGSSSLILNTTANNNVGVGADTLSANTTGTGNIAIGRLTLTTNNTGTFNTAVGNQAERYNTSGSSNVAIGRAAFAANTTGSYNVLIGDSAGTSLQTTTLAATSLVNGTSYQIVTMGTTTAAQWIASGAVAGTVGETFTANATPGVGTGTVATTTNIAIQSLNNTFIGYSSGSAVSTGSKNVILGSYTGSAAPISATGSNFVVLSDGDGNIVASSKTAQTFALQGGTLSAGTGIAFPATQSASTDANTLDDYEEGTWTPSVGGTATYAIQEGRYTKIGRQVTIQGVIEISVIGTGSATTISGLPLPVVNGVATISVGYFANINLSVVSISGRAENATTTITFNTLAAAATGVTNPASVFKNSARIDFSGTYFV